MAGLGYSTKLAWQFDLYTQVTPPLSQYRSSGASYIQKIRDQDCNCAWILLESLEAHREEPVT